MPELKKEQAQAVFHDEGNILISASAGSGKTFVMIERLIRLISEGKASVKQILAVTFTEMAASEMKEKLKKALNKKIASEGNQRLIRELQEIPTADICTLHSFSARLIRSYFYAVGVAPDFKIIDKAESDAIKLDSVNKAFRELYERGDEWFTKILSRHLVKRSDEKLKEFVIKMSEANRVNADKEYYFKQTQALYSADVLEKLLSEFKLELNNKLNGYLERLAHAKRIFGAEAKEKVVDFINALSSDIQTVISSEDVYVVKHFENYKLELPLGCRFKGELKEVYASATAVRDGFKTLINRACKGLSDREKDFSSLDGEKEHLIGLFKICKKYEDIYDRAKREENCLDFSDLEHFALAVLEDEQIRQEVKNKYKYIFVDEYQDTNGAQEAIISKIANGNLFMVGDAKQSIYGFRGCRPEIFIDKLDKMSKNGEKTVLLNHNFRSCDSVIEMVNEIFSYSMTKDAFGMSYKDTSTLRAGGVYGENEKGRAELHFILKPKGQRREFERPRVYDILDELNSSSEKEQELTSTLVASIIEEELKKEYFDPKLKKMRPITYGDICVLTRGKDNRHVRDVVNVLVGQGIPVVSVVKENVCNYPEIRQLIDAVKLMDCFKQDIPLAGALKGPIGNFTDEELAEIVIRFNDDKLSGGFYDAFMHYMQVVDNPLSARLKEFYEYFNGIRLISDFTGAVGGLKRIIQDKNIEQCLFAESFGRLKVKRLKKFMSAGLVEGKPLSVKEFLNRVEGFPSSFGLADGAEENSVKVMTIHASKGLEFPVVIVCGLELLSNADDESKEIMFEQDLGFAVKSYNDLEKTARETPLRMIMRNRIQDTRLKEELRLFYVALTRASYSLHLTFSGSKDERSNFFLGARKFLDYVPLRIEASEHNAEQLKLSKRAEGNKTVLIGKPDQAQVEEMTGNFSFAYRHLEDTVLPLKNSVTKATHELTDDSQPPVHVLFENETTDAERGNVAHKIMEHYDFNSDEPFSSQVEGIIADGALAREDVEKINLSRLERAICSPVFDLIKDKTLYREKDFIVNIEASLVFDTQSKEEVLLQGVIDLLAVDGEEAIIIDYKYSSLEINSLKARYAKQLDLYAYALKKATGINTKRKILVNLFTGDALSI